MVKLISQHEICHEEGHHPPADRKFNYRSFTLKQSDITSA